MTHNLAAVLDKYGVTYRRLRGNQQIRCAFHDDSRASMSINLDTGLWRCFTCAIAGDAITWIEQKEGVKYGDARRILDELDDGAGGTVREESAGDASSLLPGVKRNTRNSGRAIPAWLR